jgi:pimeloyl-ACP methyl ester carboxylesterase
VVLLHGYVGDGPSTWRPQIEELSDELTVIAWHAPGARHSSDPPESFTRADYADYLARFLATLDAPTVHVAGLSFGGALTIELNRRHPDIQATLILASAYAGWDGCLPLEVAEQRLTQAMALADMSPDEFVKKSRTDLIDCSAASMLQRWPASCIKSVGVLIPGGCAAEVFFRCPSHAAEPIRVESLHARPERIDCIWGGAYSEHGRQQCRACNAVNVFRKLGSTGRQNSCLPVSRATCAFRKWWARIDQPPG